jgi:hypothetical protein
MCPLAIEQIQTSVQAGGITSAAIRSSTARSVTFEPSAHS